MRVARLAALLSLLSCLSACDDPCCTPVPACEQTCTGVCQRCDGAPPDACVIVQNEADPGTCDGSTAAAGCLQPPCMCDAGGACRGAPGSSCSRAEDCASRVCRDQVCCGGDCSGTCESCNPIYTIEDAGVCGLITAGLNPPGHCPAGTVCAAGGHCESLPPPNHPPAIAAAAPASPADAARAAVIHLAVTAADPDGDDLTYTWTSSAGSLSAHTGVAEVDWTAPAVAGYATVTVTVADGQGGSAPATWDFRVGLIQVAGDIEQPTTWQAGNIYLVTGGVLVRARLVIEPGVIVKFSPGGKLSVGQWGVIDAAGTAAERIVFTSIKDDAAGGDTNRDGAASRPNKGDWFGVYDGGSDSVFTYCEIYYAGQPYSSALSIAGASIVDHCIVAHNKSFAVNAWSADPEAVITNNQIYDNDDSPIYMTCALNMDDSNTFHDPRDPAITNRHNAIFVSDALLGAHPASWTETEIPFVVTNGLVISKPLTLGVDVIVKVGRSESVHIEPGGSLNYDHDGVVFTALSDSAHGGDTLGDGSQPFEDYWLGIFDAADNPIPNDGVHIFWSANHP